jgi:nicotinamide riboside transporter PnuC
MQLYGIDWLATICGLTGVYLLGSRKRYGFIVMMAASTSWFMVGVLIGSLPLMLGSVVFFFLHVRGWFKWRREGEAVGMQ